MAHAPLGIRRIARITWNQVDVDVENTLSGSATHVNTYVVTIWTEFFIKYLALIRDQRHTSRHLFGGEIEDTGTVPKRHDQRMARADGVAVARAVRQLVTPRHPAWCAEKARIVRIVHPWLTPSRRCDKRVPSPSTTHWPDGCTATT